MGYKIKNVYIWNKLVWGEGSWPTPGLEFDYDFSIDNQWFSTAYTIDPWVSYTYDTNYGLGGFINWSVTAEWQVYWPLKQELYDAWTPLRIEFNTIWINGGAWLCVDASWARGWAINSSAGYNGNYLNITTFDWQKNLTPSGLNNFVGHKITMDFESWIISAEWATATYSFDKAYYLNQWQQRSLAMCLVGYGGYNERTYISSAKFVLSA